MRLAWNKSLTLFIVKSLFEFLLIRLLIEILKILRNENPEGMKPAKNL